MALKEHGTPATKVFWEDAYLTHLQTEIASVHGEQVWLRATNFFAFSGGQESDAGTIAGHPVLKAEKDGFDIVYTLAPGHGLSAGDPVEVVIDWDRRYSLMRHHFAAEMVLQLVYRFRPGIERVGAHISADKARIDFASESNISVLFPGILDEVATLIAGEHPIVTAFSDEATQRRYWAVEGFARMACGGTHPRRTTEIGSVKLRRKNQGKGIERIEITLPPMAAQWSKTISKDAHEAGHLLGLLDEPDQPTLMGTAASRSPNESEIDQVIGSDVNVSGCGCDK